jgi:hypothetical protein
VNLRKFTIIFISFLLFSCSFSRPEQTDWQTFENEIIPNNQIKKTIIYDNEVLYIFIKIDPGPYKNKRKKADYKIILKDSQISNIREVDSKLEELVNKTGQKAIYPIYAESGNPLLQFAFTVLPFLLALLLIILWIMSINNILKSKYLNQNKKIIWIIFVIVFPFIGILVYLFFRQKTK